MTATSGASMALVESSAPPMPTSSTTMSHFASKKYSRAMAVTSSNWLGWSSIASAMDLTRSVIAARVSPGTFAPLTCMRSQKSWIYGLM